jgi:hypothetical protein
MDWRWFFNMIAYSVSYTNTDDQGSAGDSHFDVHQIEQV